ncbi:hypothetical protein [Micromonospora sp. WMMD1155]|uniref:hypothetical protein n=1 Tax=Micromonospora sp. WMMD1155 TaxID=3016094 RepID=UPI00249BF58C|nr:hypothetical protein [Micromonospora sp. WMMD1155]WFE53393.1 hypothetical protein O7617_25095 [Micromonospora sp. WMMD1155]
MTMMTRPGRSRYADLIVLGVEVAVLAAAVGIGALLNHRGVRLHADAAPLYATWRPHLGFGTPVALLVGALFVWRGTRWAADTRWPRLLVVGYLASVLWTLSLALVDGWSAGVTERLTVQAEYLHEVPRVTDVGLMLSGFADRILDFQPNSWSTHTAAHPPGALLFFVGLDRIGLGGGAAAGLACVLLGATVSVSVPVTLRALGAADAARAVWPFLVLFPGAVWVGVSADGIFAAVVAGGLALVAVGGRPAAVPGGLLLGFALYLSYGFVLVGLLALTVVLLRARDRLAVLLVAATAGAVVVAAFTASGFWWPDGYQLVTRRYYQGWAADRPYGYWVWANLAALLLSAGPVVGPALRRAVASLSIRRAVPAGSARPPHRSFAAALRERAVGAGPTVWLPVAAAVAVLAADLSGLSKAEVERIWLPFTVWLLVATAHLPAGHRRWWLAAQAGTALAVNHLLWTVS